VPIGKHEAIAHDLADMAATTYAMESVADVVGALADRKDRDIRLEAAAAKEWNTERGWQISDRALQIRGGRGYETERSLAARGEPAIGIERMLRDSRINRIFEGSSEIMHLFIAREAVDKHLEVAGALIDPKLPLTKKLARLPAVALFYAGWYPLQWLGTLLSFFQFWNYGSLGGHLRAASRASRHLARSIFHGMLRFGPKLERKQAFLFRAVDVALELFALTAAVERAARAKDPEREGALMLADQFARSQRRRIDDLLRDMWSNDDARKLELAHSLLDGKQLWLEQGSMGLGFSVDELRPQTMEEYFEARKRPTADSAPRIVRTGTSG
jgi:alkylation response protein AidB-like acyl-CoA dehydrogenase